MKLTRNRLAGLEAAVELARTVAVVVVAVVAAAVAAGTEEVVVDDSTHPVGLVTEPVLVPVLVLLAVGVTILAVAANTEPFKAIMSDRIPNQIPKLRT